MLEIAQQAMSYHEYRTSQEIEARDFPFYALIMAAMRKADTDNLFRLQRAFPETWRELLMRYHEPGGRLEGDG